MLIEADESADLPSSDTTAPGTAAIVSRTTQSVEIAVDASVPCMLVLADAYYPGWQATIDGDPATIYPAYYALRAVAVPAGTHSVRFEYTPKSFWIGYGISVIGLLVGAVLAIVVLRRRV